MSSRSIFVNIKQKPLFILSLLICVYVFLKNAWVTDDAFILFRSLEQLFAGNGPNWNPHERVQVYTSPLWYFALAFTRLFTENYYLIAILVSGSFLLATLVILRKLLRDDARFFLVVLISIGSNGFYDYTSSGLENSMAYFLLSLFLLYYFELFSRSKVNEADPKQIREKIILLMVLFGLIILVRHDLGLLPLPAVVYLIYTHRKTFSLRQWIRLSIVSALPLILFTAFSIIYYGFPFPNTAYAKAFTGIETLDLIRQGLKYLYVTLRYDTLTILIILGAIIITWVQPIKKHLRFLIVGVLLNIAYIIYVGGDFMQGRFFSYSFLISMVILANWFPEMRSLRTQIIAYAVIGLYLVFYPHTPLNSPLEYSNRDFHMGITDERGFYFDDTSLYRYANWDRETQIFPRSANAIEGREFKRGDQDVIVGSVIGIYGYFAGTEKIIIDTLALADPFLARLPVEKDWRIGHFPRQLPQGYLESVSSNQNLVVDPQLHAFYEKMRVITQSDDLFSLERLEAIFKMNFRGYDHLLPAQ